MHFSDQRNGLCYDTVIVHGRVSATGSMPSSTGHLLFLVLPPYYCSIMIVLVHIDLWESVVSTVYTGTTLQEDC